MDIDVTRKLRPQKASELLLRRPAPSEPPTSTLPPGIVPSSSDIPTPEEVQTIRFTPAATNDSLGQYPLVEPDPVTGWLIVMKGMGRGRSLSLGYGIHPVGRAEDQRVCVRFGDKKISRRSHVEICYDGKGRAFYLSPGRGSTLGYLNGHPVLHPSLLKAGDRIALGDTELAFMPFCGDAFDWQEV